MALFGALFHTVNHGTFKALLFLNAGSMLHATGTQDLNRLGGLMKWMPWTAATALVASLSISGVPMFNGFASKWSLYVATILGSAQAGYLAVFAAIAILTSGLTLASFIKFFGASFLSRTSALVAEQAAGRRSLEVGWLMRVPQVALALVCVGLGLFPSLAGRCMELVLQSSRQGLGAVLAGNLPLRGSLLTGLSAGYEQAVLSTLAVLVALGMALCGVRLLARLGGSSRRQAPPWLCGYAQEAEANRYDAHGFYGELKRWFRGLGGGEPARPKDKKAA